MGMELPGPSAMSKTEAVAMALMRVQRPGITDADLNSEPYHSVKAAAMEVAAEFCAMHEAHQQMQRAEMAEPAPEVAPVLEVPPVEPTVEPVPEPEMVEVAPEPEHTDGLDVVTDQPHTEVADEHVDDVGDEK